MSFSGGTTTSLRSQELRKREGLLAKAALVLLLFMGAAIFFVWTRSQVIQLGLQASELKRQENQAMRRNQGLLMEKAALRRIERIEQIAKDKLGMVFPDPKLIKVVNNVQSTAEKTQ